MRTLFRVLKEIDVKARTYFAMTLVVRLFATALDMVGLALVGIAASLLAGVNQAPDSVISNTLRFLSQLGVENTYAVFGVIASIFFLLKTLISIWLNAIVSSFLANLETDKSTKLLASLEGATIGDLGEWNEKELSLAINDSTSAAYNYALLGGSVIFGESILILAICIFLAVQNFLFFLVVALYFGLFASAVSFFVNKKTHSTSLLLNKTTVRTQTMVKEYFNLVRELRLSGMSKSFVRQFRIERSARSRAQSSLNRLSFLPRYIVESALMFGITLILIQRSMSNYEVIQASTVAIFLTGALRIVASLIPLQSSLASMKSIDAQSAFAFKLEQSVGERNVVPAKRKGSNTKGLRPVIQLQNLEFCFPWSKQPLIRDANFRIPFGSYVGIIGSSGAGKSTLTDLIVGVQDPTKGSVEIGGQPSSIFVKENPGMLAFVPQKCHLIVGTILENVVMEISPFEIDEKSLSEALHQSNLNEFISSLPEGLNTPIGEGVRELSGGQVQRIALARALYRKPKVLVLDEPTSSLDKESKKMVYDLLRQISQSATVICTTHNEAQISHFDFVLEVSDGIVAKREN